MSQEVNIQVAYDGQNMPYSVNYGTTANQVAGNNYIRQALGLPANVTPLVNGQHSTAPLNEGDTITFLSAPSQKAEEEKTDEAAPHTAGNPDCGECGEKDKEGAEGAPGATLA